MTEGHLSVELNFSRMLRYRIASIVLSVLLFLLSRALKLAKLLVRPLCGAARRKMRGLFAAAVAAALASVQANDAWPMPSTFIQGSSTTYVDPSFRIACATASPACPDPLTAAFARYQNMIFWAGQPVASTGANKITGLQVLVGSEANLSLGVDESYNLTVPVSGIAQIAANTQWGALRGLETFSQLTAWAGNGVPTAYAVDSAPLSVADAPRFQWRGTVSCGTHSLVPRQFTVTFCLRGQRMRHLTRPFAFPTSRTRVHRCS